MEHAARRPMIALAALTTAGALGLAPVVVTPPDLHAPTITQSQISARELQLTDAWSDLFAATGANVTELVKLFVGAESGVPLPNPTIFLAPIATQIVLNQLIYVGQLFSGQGGQIPGEIQTHLTNVGKVMGEVIPALPQILGLWVQTPFAAIQQALASISTAANPLIGVLEAPAVFLNFALNTTTGLLGAEGPIGFPITVRNVLATAIDPPLPGWLSHILQPGKPAGAVSSQIPAPKSAIAASSARAGSKSASATASKASPAKTAHRSSSGTGHSKRD
jgi:hypothetical protein